MVRRTDPDALLSFAQEGFLVLKEMVPGNAFSTLVDALHTEGPLDVALLRRTLAAWRGDTRCCARAFR